MKNKYTSFTKFKENFLSKKRKKRLYKKFNKNIRELYIQYVSRRDSSLSAAFFAHYMPEIEAVLQERKSENLSWDHEAEEMVEWLQNH